MQPTLEIAKKVLTTVDAGLCSGVGDRIPGKMCVEAAVCFAFDLPHGDNPPCVGSAVRSFKIALNDCNWSSNGARAKGMRKLAIAQLGSNELDQRKFSELLALRIIEKLCPLLFRELAKLAKTDKDKAAMEQTAVDCENATDLKVAIDKLGRPLALAGALASAPTIAHAVALARALTFDHTLTLTLARTVALALALDPDETLTLLSDICLGVLVEIKSPGCEWLPLCN